MKNTLSIHVLGVMEHPDLHTHLPGFDLGAEKLSYKTC